MNSVSRKIKTGNPRNGRFFGWAVFCLLLFTVSDATFLQYYEGNETLGIPGYNQTVKVSFAAVGDDSSSADIVARADESQPDAPQPDAPPQNCCECFGCSPNVLLGFQLFLKNPSIVAYRQNHLFFPKFQFSESHLGSLFRPPRLA